MKDLIFCIIIALTIGTFYLLLGKIRQLPNGDKFAEQGGVRLVIGAIFCVFVVVLFGLLLIF